MVARFGVYWNVISEAISRKHTLKIPKFRACPEIWVKIGFHFKVISRKHTLKIPKFRNFNVIWVKNPFHFKVISVMFK